MTQDTHHGHVEPPVGHRPAPRTILLWVGLASMVVLIVALGLASHRPGVPTVTPGRKAPSVSETALNTLSDTLQALPIAHPRAATRQADAKG